MTADQVIYISDGMCAQASPHESDHGREKRTTV